MCISVATNFSCIRFNHLCESCSSHMAYCCLTTTSCALHSKVASGVNAITSVSCRQFSKVSIHQTKFIIASCNTMCYMPYIIAHTVKHAAYMSHIYHTIPTSNLTHACRPSNVYEMLRESQPLLYTHDDLRTTSYNHSLAFFCFTTIMLHARCPKQERRSRAIYIFPKCLSVCTDFSRDSVFPGSRCPNQGQLTFCSDAKSLCSQWSCAKRVWNE